MDVTSILNNTIDTLSSTHIQEIHPVAEIQMMHHNNSNESGNTQAAFEKAQGVVEQLNKAALSVDKRVSFSYSEETKRVIMRVVDPNTNELVRQIPSREMIKLLERINDMTGTFVDETR